MSARGLHSMCGDWWVLWHGARTISCRKRACCGRQGFNYGRCCKEALPSKTWTLHRVLRFTQSAQFEGRNPALLQSIQYLVLQFLTHFIPFDLLCHNSKINACVPSTLSGLCATPHWRSVSAHQVPLFKCPISSPATCSAPVAALLPDKCLLLLIIAASHL